MKKAVLGYNFAVKMPSYSLPGHVVSQSCKNATSDRSNKYLESLDQWRDDNLIHYKPDKNIMKSILLPDITHTTLPEHGADSSAQR